jgi:HlyD family secretion protein
MEAIKSKRAIIAGTALAALALVLWFATRPPPLTVQGEATSDRIDISPRVAGRVLKLNANVGDTVKQGDVIVELDSPQLVAALGAAKAAFAVASADLDRINAIRPENIDARKAEVAAANADVTLSQETYNRQAELAKSGNTPQARVDEATRNLEAAMRKRDSAEAVLKLTIEGASKEERALSEAQVKQAEAAVNQRSVDVNELTIHAPVTAQVTTRAATIGENFSAGAPLFSLIDLNNVWFTFNLREDLLSGLKIGDTFDVTIPAFKGKTVPVRVTMINVQGQYATWRATRATGDFDLRTFEVRAVPVEPLEGLRPGMSAIAAWSGRDR